MRIVHVMYLINRKLVGSTVDTVQLELLKNNFSHNCRYDVYALLARIAKTNAFSRLVKKTMKTGLKVVHGRVIIIFMESSFRIINIVWIWAS